MLDWINDYRERYGIIGLLVWFGRYILGGVIIAAPILLVVKVFRWLTK